MFNIRKKSITCWLEIIIWGYLILFFTLFIHLPDPTYGDESILLNGAYRILNGEIIYKDFVEYIGPIPFFIFSFLFKIFSPKVAVARFFNVVCITTTAVFLYMILLKATSNKFLSLCSVLTYILTGYPFWYITSHHWILLAIEIVIIFFLLRRQDLNTLSGFIIGILTGSLPLIIQHKGGAFFISILVYLWLFYPVRIIFNFLSGVIVLPAIVLLYFLYENGLMEFFNNLILHNFFLISQTQYKEELAFPYYFFSGWSAIKLFYNSINFTDIPRSIYLLFKIIYYLILGYSAFIILPLFALWLYLKRKVIDGSNFAQYLLCILIAIFTYTVIILQRTDQYQLIMIYPFVLILCVTLLNSIKGFKFLIAGFITLLTAGALFYSLQWAVTIKREYIYKVNTPTGDVIYYNNKELAHEMQEFYLYSNENINDDQILALYLGDKFYFYLKKKNPLKFNIISPIHLLSSEVEEIVKKIKETTPSYIIWDRYGTREWDYAAWPLMKKHAEKFVKNPLIDYIKDNYNVTAYFPVANIMVFKRK